MNHLKTQLTKVEEGIEIQTQQLANWRTKLNDKCYNALEAFALASNEGRTDPYNILRGSNLDCFVANWKDVEVTDSEEFHKLGFILSTIDDTDDLYVEKIDYPENFKEELQYDFDIPKLADDAEAIKIARKLGLFVTENGVVKGRGNVNFLLL